MEDNSLTDTASKAARPSLIEAFSIEGLYGYRNISLESQYAATVLIARNGTGKTTLLGALDAILKLQLSRLRDLPFERIELRLRDVQESLVLTHDDVIEFLAIPESSVFSRVVARTGLDPAQVFDYLTNTVSDRGRSERYDPGDRIGMALRAAFSYNHTDQESSLIQAREELYSRHPRIAALWKGIRQALADTEVVYLPTYRRIELALQEPTRNSVSDRAAAPKFAVASGSLYPGDIQFGLADIQARLRGLNNSIIGASNNGYRRISANIINDLLDGSFATQVIKADELPSREELTLFFSRIRDGRREVAYDPVSAPNLEKLSALNDMPEASRQFLAYFLSQLGQVIDTTKNLEVPVDTFINVCNKYLAAEEPSTQKGERDPNAADDSKLLKLNRKNLAVHVESVIGGRRISLNALSSGEKQMISLFAKLFLYPRRKVVLIDEPELSLSIDWQAQILVDVLNSPLCEQVIAITHSPFVFENELDPFARPLGVSLRLEPQTALLLGDEPETGLDDDAE